MFVCVCVCVCMIWSLWWCRLSAAEAGATSTDRHRHHQKWPSHSNTQTHTNMHTNKHTCITVIILFPGFLGGLFFLNGPSDIFHTDHPALVQRRRATAVTLSLAHVLWLHKAIVLLMTLYSKQLSPGASALVALSFWDQPATLVSFNIQNKFFCHCFSNAATTSFE